MSDKPETPEERKERLAAALHRAMGAADAAEREASTLHGSMLKFELNPDEPLEDVREWVRKRHRRTRVESTDRVPYTVTRPEDE